MTDQEYKARSLELAKKNLVRREKNFIRRERQDNINMATNIISIVFVLLLIVMLFRISSSSAPPTFTSLLQKLSTASVPTIPFIDMSSISLGDWGNILNPIRDFISFLLSIVNVLVFFCNGIISAITYIVWFLQWVFV